MRSNQSVQTAVEPSCTNERAHRSAFPCLLPTTPCVQFGKTPADTPTSPRTSPQVRSMNNLG